MNETKSRLASKGVWGGAIALLASLGQVLEVALPVVGPMMGLDISPDDTTEAKGYVLSIIAACGGLLAMYGRITATKAIG